MSIIDRNNSMDGRNGKLGYLCGGLYDVILCYDAKRGSFTKTAAIIRVPQDSSQLPNSV